MAKEQTDHLFQLIKSMSKSEKRNFRLYTRRTGNTRDAKFIRLFELLDKQEEYDESEILQKARDVKSRQLPNLKAHLYKQLLKSLRQKPMNIDAEIELHEQMDFARMLYNKGLYKQALKILSKTRALAHQYNKQLTELEIVEFEKLIELQYITRSQPDRARQLKADAGHLHRHIQEAGRASNLALCLYDHFLKNGLVKKQADVKAVQQKFGTQLQELNTAGDASFFSSLYAYQSQVWYFYILQDFLACYKYAQKWVDLFKKTPAMLDFYPDIYLKGLHNLLSTLYMLGHIRRFREVLQQLEAFKEHEMLTASRNNTIRYWLYFYTHKMNGHFLEGTFTQGLQVVDEVRRFIGDYRAFLDTHRILVFYFKMASMHFGSGQHHQAVRYLNAIIQYKEISIRRDIQVYAHILNLITHFELGNEEFIEYQIKTTYRHLARLEDNSMLSRSILQFLRRLVYIERSGLPGEFRRLLIELKHIQQDPYEKHAIQYLDIISWLESKLQNRPVQDIIQEKARNV